MVSGSTYVVVIACESDGVWKIHTELGLAV